MGNLPIRNDLVVDMDPFWSKFRAMWPWLEPGYERPDDGREYRISQERMNVIHKEALCINCGCCVSECNAMESDPEFLGPQALAKGMRFVGDPRDGATVERLERYNQEHGIWDCTRCYFCNERCPKGVDPRDAIAKLGAESIRLGIDRDMGAKHAKWFVRSAETTGWLREEELIPKTQGYVSAIKQPMVGLELVELESVTCCGAGDIHEAEPDYYLHLNARILAYAEATGCDMLMTVCNVCTLNLRQANYMLQGDDELLARVNENLETVGVPPYSGGVEVRHMLWEIAEGEGYELLKKVAHRGLKGLKVAPFYGCQILRPSKILGFEDPDRPWSLERIIEACGGEAIDYPAKIKCCGFPIIQAREETAMGELIQPVEQAMEAGADVMVTPCPLCHLSLDAGQQKPEAATGRTLNLPILHLSQLVGVAAGLADSELKFKRHIVDPRPALEKLEV